MRFLTQNRGLGGARAGAWSLLGSPHFRDPPRPSSDQKIDPFPMERGAQAAEPNGQEIRRKHLSHGQKTRGPLLSIESWLFDRDPFI